MRTSRSGITMARWYDHAERYLMLASPFLFVVGFVLAWMHVPGAYTGVLVLAAFDLTFFALRMGMHTIANIQRGRYKQSALFGLLAVPLVAYICYTQVVAEQHIYNLAQLPWFQFLILAVAFILSIVFWYWYVTKKAFQLR